ncbi:MAG: winged helix-turn-helix transcriptional regulator [Pseudobacteriovorax sp.]|nr:winged helix-turn-helix transcriptional regulator [Pseudobacteriovorax sp.]
MENTDTRRSHIGRSLFEASTLFNRLAVKLMQDKGFGDIKKMDIDVISQIPSQGATNIITIAYHLGISKQAVSQKVKSLVDRDYLKKEAPPSHCDTRYADISFTAKGLRLLHCGLTITQDLEAHFAKTLGDQQYADLVLKIDQLNSLLTRLNE